ncbi:FAD-dependent oxidoreductase [Chitinophaga oryzae]|uniref:FAD-dependent oxidoreductase n=1 Tax=Chitinophaga oryzae TaxID=2725414 RepID=UPI001C661427|nr:FAD-dependent oxidoreductase [Chitinophaga oryzae]
MKVIIIGGGIIGLGSAYYLQQAGYSVTVVDRTDMLQGCSYGNAGYVCPATLCRSLLPALYGRASNGC